MLAGLFTGGKCFAEHFPYPVILASIRPEDQRPDSQQIHQTIRQNHALVGFDIQHFPDELRVQPQLQTVPHLALNNQEALLDVWRIHHLAPRLTEPRVHKFINVAPRCHPAGIHLLELALGWNADRKNLPRDKIRERLGGLAQGHRHTRRLGATDTAPRHRRNVRVPVIIVGPDEKDWRGIRKDHRAERLFHAIIIPLPYFNRQHRYRVAAGQGGIKRRLTSRFRFLVQIQKKKLTGRAELAAG